MRKRQLLVMVSWVVAAGAVLVTLGPVPADDAKGGAAPPAERQPLVSERPPRPDVSARGPGAPGGGRPESRPRSPWMGRRRPVSPEEEKRLLGFAKEYAPRMHERIVGLKKTNPRVAQRLLMGMRRLYYRAMAAGPEVRGDVVKIATLNIEILKVRDRLHRASDEGAKRDLAKRLRELVTGRFDSELVVQEDKVRELAGRLAALKAEVQKRRENRDALIEALHKKLLEEAPRFRRRPGTRHRKNSHPGR